MTSPDPLAQAVMVAYCGWDPTVSLTTTVALDGNGTPLLTLPCLHVTAVSSVVITDGWGTVTTLTPAIVPPSTTPGIGSGNADVSWSENGTLIYKGVQYAGAWPQDQGNIVVTYTGGYEGPPDDLAAALTNVSKRMPLVGATSQHAGPFGVNYAPTVAQGGLLLVEQMVFDRYRLPRVA